MIENFTLRSYTKAELAHLYNPTMTYDCALRTFRRWLIRVPVLCDELLYPVLKHPEAPAAGASLRLLCSETSNRHTMIISFRGIDSDPLEEPYLDELNLALLNNYAEFVLSRKKDDGWEVCIQM